MLFNVESENSRNKQLKTHITARAVIDVECEHKEMAFTIGRFSIDIMVCVKEF